MTSTQSFPEGPLFLGLDLSTQANKASLLSSSLELLSEVAVNFDKELPKYGTKGGVLLGPEGSGQVFSPVLMAVESFDKLAEKIKAANWPTDRIKAVSAAGQQHASVYWSRSAPELLKGLTASGGPLVKQLEGAFSRSIVPNWQDSSTSQECRDFEAHVSGSAKLAHLTGSRAYERFTGPQILRFRREDPAAYEQTERISLVSSFVTTMLCVDGEIKGIDESDACGMNLWNISSPQRGWAQDLVELIAGGKGPEADELLRKLGSVESDGGRIVGRIGKWWQDKLGFPADCLVCPATGDNPATLLSFALHPREALVSLGTSDTLLIPTPNFKPSETFHVFYHPARVATANSSEASSSSAAAHEGDYIDTHNRYFNMLVYKNGSLAREAIRDQYNDGSWDKFDEAVRGGWPSGSSSKPDSMGFYWLKEEIIPPNAKGTHLYKRSGSGSAAGWQEAQTFERPEVSHAQAIVASQLLSFKSRVGAILDADGDSVANSSSSGLLRIHASGGASSNMTLLQTMADVMDCDLVKPSNEKEQAGNACSVGAAFKARWAWERSTQAGREKVPFEVCVQEARASQQHAGQSSTPGGVKILGRPHEERVASWNALVSEWVELEKRALQQSRQ
ncbi:unnamed protein product [Parajaminaea phylloscopi]